MSLRAFFKLVEIQTKLASLFPFLVGCLFAMYRYHAINLITTLIFLVRCCSLI
ncbi:putative prenyltransferase [Sporolactobacillus inulinus]|uniref:Putative prenyltransferase n=1 Tax=Sporolactobacillus inulinus TaxID=2078 RepID=A0A4Y1ZBV8_9BACL|nr:putative prenyltransferase [Sporolactobacillus inulinus]